MTARRHSFTVTALVATLAVASLLSACSLGSPARDAAAESATVRLAQALDEELSGAHIPDRSALTARVRAAYPDVVQSEVGRNLRYATLEADDHRLPADTPVALAVWERSTGADPFTNDVPRWHVYCAQLSVDRTRAALQATPVRCPRGTPEEPDDAGGQLEASPVLDREGPDDGTLLWGEPARSGEPTEPHRATTPSTATHPCAPEDLDAAFQLLSTAGNTDDGSLRIINTSTLPCIVRGPLHLSVHQGSEGQRTSGTANQAEVTLAPRESLSAAVSWRPSQKVSAEPQRLTATVNGDDLPVRLGAGMPLAPLSVDPGEPLVVGRWRVSGYGPPLSDLPTAVDIAAPCDPHDLAAQTSQPRGGSGDSEPPAPTVSVINLGATACRFGRGDLPSFQDLTGLPAFAATPVTVLRPGDHVTAPTTTPVVHHPGELLVAGRWVATIPGQ